MTGMSQMSESSTARTLGQLLDADWNRLRQFGGQPPAPRRFASSFSPRFASVVWLRVAQRLYARGWTRLAKVVSFANLVVFGIEVPARLDIGAGLVLPHPQGTIIGAGFVGENVTIYQQVTLGAKVADFDFNVAARPNVSNGVLIGAGAKVLGPVRLGENSRVGANAVVLIDVPPGALAAGVPATIVRTGTPASN
jgi:serine O-acetyltransferase